MRRYSHPSIHGNSTETASVSNQPGDSSAQTTMDRFTRNGEHRHSSSLQRDSANDSDHVVYVNEMLGEGSTSNSNMNGGHNVFVPAGAASSQPRSSHVMVGRGLSQLARQFSTQTGADITNFALAATDGDNDGRNASEEGNQTDENTNGPTTASEVIAARLVGEVGPVCKNLLQFLPFVLIVLLKILYDHRLGIGVYVGGLILTLFANNKIKHQIVLTDYRSIKHVALITAFLLSNICLVFYVFSPHKLYKSLLLLQPSFREKHLDLWTVLWILVIADFVIKCQTMIIKCAVISLPQSVLAFKHRGKYYCVIELVGQFYRSLIPIMPWGHYLISDTSEAVAFNVLLLTLYTVFKGFIVITDGISLKSTIQDSLREVSHGVVPELSELQACDNICPICQDELTKPIKLNCKHIFCDDCISVWFDKESTCPMCRSSGVAAARRRCVEWRDGTTSMYIYVY